MIYMKFSKEARTGICMQDEEVDVGELVQSPVCCFSPVYCPNFSTELRFFPPEKNHTYICV